MRFAVHLSRGQKITSPFVELRQPEKADVGVRIAVLFQDTREIGVGVWLFERECDTTSSEVGEWRLWLDSSRFVERCRRGL